MNITAEQAEKFIAIANQLSPAVTVQTILSDGDIAARLSEESLLQTIQRISDYQDAL